MRHNDLVDDPLRIADEVADALADGRPVVALESTIIAHGMPHPRNVETAFALESLIRSGGAVPATVALVDGTLRVGLFDDDIEQLGSTDEVAKVSLRDVGAVLASGRLGATTVAATMFAAHRAGIRVFATGGIGGVHRGDDHDISADLTALGRFPVAVVCAGAKAVLDLPRTLEALETLGVPVLGWRTEAFPEFWTRGADLPVDARVDGADHAAAVLDTHWSAGLTTGAVLGVPIPTGHEADRAVIDAAITDGLAAAEVAGITGSDITPFLLAHIGDATGGASLDANVALVQENANVATEVAVALATTR
ncbi:MAG: pseudouridine-5'-phosphate glycosidase [Acidimicrobiales bacterium]|nr:pseudouridine-5'-phosphate glycosidase [Acidimicrobiales bacterium]MDP7507215.1 pseudouridine-5'-phosphate glycosidase [Acidimicrobiales bacterium]